MNVTKIDTTHLSDLVARIESLEQRVLELEAGQSSPPRRAAAARSVSPEVDASDWTRPYAVAHLEVSETWIELHEPSARPQLQRLLREVVAAEGPITERLALDRIRRAWGLKRAGGRVQEAFDQAVRQLVARGLVERAADALQEPGTELARVRVPDTADELTRRGAEEVPIVELAAALAHAVGSMGAPFAEDELTMRIAKLFGWTRRGGAIQERLDAAIAWAADQGMIVRSSGMVSAAD